MQYYEHITKQSERWDTLAYFWYGDAMLLRVIAECNPHISLTTVLPTGTLVFVPKLNLDRRPDINKLPPWKQRGAGGV
jgi:hypothetical protein